MNKILTGIFNREVKIVNGKYLFKEILEDEYNLNLINRIKSKIKGNQKVYRFFIELFSPVFTYYSNKYLKEFIFENFSDSNKLFLNLGSGNSIIDENVINVDFFPYKNVNIVCDIDNIPINDDSIDLISNIAVLEHVPCPEIVVKEIHRILKPGGKVYSIVPFIQGFHASPYDFNRRTFEGMKILYKDYDIETVKCIGGPTSGVLWILQEWLSILFSFGNARLHSIVYGISLILLFPLKFLDFILIHHPLAKNISSAFLVIASKKTL